MKKFLFTFLLLSNYCLLFAQTTEPMLTLNTEMHTANIGRISTDKLGKYILTCSKDKTAKLWDAQSGDLIRTFRPPIGQGNEGMLYACALSPDGKIAAVGGWSYFDKNTFDIYLFDVVTGTLLHRIGALPNVIFDIEFSPDGRYMVATLGDEEIRIYSIPDNFAKVSNFGKVELLKSFTDYGADSYNAAFDQSGRLATVCYDGKIRLYSNTFELLKEKETTAGKKPFSLAFSPDGALLAVGYHDSYKIEVRDGKTLKLLYEPDVTDANTLDDKLEMVSFSYNGNDLMAGYAYKKNENGKWWRQIRVWENQGKGSYADYAAGDNTIMDIKPLPDNSFVFAGFKPDFGRFTAAGAKTLYKAAETNAYNAKDKTHFKINTDASQVGVTPLGGDALSFSIKDRLLQVKRNKQMDSLWNLGWELYEKEEYDKAIEINKEALTIKPNEGFYVSIAFNLGLSYLAKGLINQADEWYQKAIQINKQNSEIVQNKKLDEAMQDINDFMQKKGEMADAKKIVALLSENKIKSITIDPMVSTDAYAGITVTDWNDSYSPKINSKSTHFLKTNERNHCVDISKDAKKIVFGTGWNIYCTDAAGTKLWTAPVQGEAFAVNISGDDKTVVAAGDGTIRWYSMADGSLLLSLYLHPDNKRWLLWSPQGYFDCSPGAEELIGWHVNQGADKEALYFPASKFYEQFYVPNLGARVLAGEKITQTTVKIQDFKLPPFVKITSPNAATAGFKWINNMLQAEQQNISITVEVTDQGGGIDEILLYLNDKLVETTNRGFKAVVQTNDKRTRSFNIQLSNGINTIKATAFSTQRIESLSDELKINFAGTQTAKPDLYLFAIGIDQYKNTRYNLNYAVADAKAFGLQIETGSKEIFKQIHTTYITNTDATKQRIIQEFNKIKGLAKPEDVFIFYYAGHGVMSEEEKSKFYLVPHDVTQLYGNAAMLSNNAVSADELRQISADIRAQKQMFVMDACQSGGMVEMLASRGAEEERAIAQLARSTGTYWLAASGSQQFATEFTALGHGLFTYTILQGLAGKADAQNDKKVTVQELSAHLNDQVPELSAKHRGSAQYPSIFGYGMDFPIIILK